MTDKEVIPLPKPKDLPEVGELIFTINNILSHSQSQINQVCSAIAETNKTLVKDREESSISVTRLAQAMLNTHNDQKGINKDLFDKIADLAEALLQQSKITREQTNAISEVSKSINKLTQEFIDHRGRSQEKDKTNLQSQSQTKEMLHRLDDKMDRMHSQSEKLNTRLAIVESNRIQESGFMSNTFSRTMAILTLVCAVSLGIMSIIIKSGST